MILTPTGFSTKMVRTALLAVLVVAALGIQVSKASAYSNSVRSACTGDYLNFCSHISPDSPKVRGCMREAGPKLSNLCVKALVKAGLVSKSRTKRRTARRSSRRASRRSWRRRASRRRR